ncbi:MAG: metallophosphoesterase [Candidatus Moranbacteria bacterium]|nr:metallophosphoesterase [Candidatus Moranbacteria bacterium]
MNKKRVAILILSIVAIIVLSLFFFRSPQKTKKTALPAANSPASPDLHSFKGVITLIADVVTGNIPDAAQNQTPVAAPPEKSKIQGGFSLAIIGDTKLFDDSPASGNLQKAVDSISKQNVDMVFAVGDLVFKCGDTSSCENSYSDWKTAMSPLISKTYEVVGNHDRSGGSLADDVWQKEFDLPTNGPADFQKQAYSFDFQNSHFVVLDTEKPRGGAVNLEQRLWLEQDLAAHKLQHTFVLFHEPAFPTSQFKRKSLDADTRQRDALWKIMVQNNVTAVINGHEHFFTRKKVGSIYQFIVGNTDAPENAIPVPKLSDYSYVGNIYAIVTVSGAKMNMSLYSGDGKLINSFDF